MVDWAQSTNSLTNYALACERAMAAAVWGFHVLTRAATDPVWYGCVLSSHGGHHKACRRWTWHSPNGQHHNQIDNILVRKRFRSGVNIARTRSFPGADIGSDHYLLMMTFNLRLKKKSASQNTKDSSLTSKR